MPSGCAYPSSRSASASEPAPARPRAAASRSRGTISAARTRSATRSPSVSKLPAAALLVGGRPGAIAEIGGRAEWACGLEIHARFPRSRYRHPWSTSEAESRRATPALNHRAGAADSDPVNVALALLVFPPALAFGSFVNVVAARVPLRRSISKPRSACTGCGTEIAARDNIPIVSYLLLRGRCRHCHEHISAIYPAVEALTAALVVACVLAFGATAYTILASFFVIVLVTLSAADLRYRLVPNRIVLPAAGDLPRRHDHPRAEPGVGARRARCVGVPARRRARLPEGDGHGRRQVRPPARCDARPRRLRGAHGRLHRGARFPPPCSRFATARRHARWRSPSLRSSRSAPSSPCSSATPFSTGTSASSARAPRDPAVTSQSGGRPATGSPHRRTCRADAMCSHTPRSACGEAERSLVDEPCGEAVEARG